MDACVPRVASGDVLLPVRAWPSCLPGRGLRHGGGPAPSGDALPGLDRASSARPAGGDELEHLVATGYAGPRGRRAAAACSAWFRIARLGILMAFRAEVLLLFASSGAGTAQHQLAAWAVEDLEAEGAELRRRGVVFEEYDSPGLHRVNGIAG